MKSTLSLLSLFLFFIATPLMPVAQGATGSSQRCLECHRFDDHHEAFNRTVHGALACSDCHRHPLSSAFHASASAKTSPASTAVLPPDKARLSEEALLSVNSRCEKCHRETYADWARSGHAMTYAQAFLNPQHNRDEQPMNDCLRCHGMFWTGTIEALVTPTDTRGPWKLKRPNVKSRPAIPCLACHQIHPNADPLPPGSSKSPFRTGVRHSDEAQNFGFYDRREKRFINAADLPHPRIARNHETVRLSNDLRLRNCYQCHAPDATHQPGTSDDRTLRGVHEGFSCADCHATHSLSTRGSCAKCHPQQSHCGLDVEQMDTSFRMTSSQQDIHTVACVDCHSQGRP
jgi:hypothetical protein